MSSTELPSIGQQSTAERSADSRRLARLPAVSLTISAIVVAALFANGGWQRRWIADDGLIVLRTVRNLLAGNGPVFNEGERVETNTSTVWTYLIWFWTWLTDGKPEYVVLWLALVLSVLALPIAMYATYRLYRRSAGLLFLPLGVLVYIALPPARDFATSGLEVSLCIFWSAVLWWQVIAWSQRPVHAGAGGAAATLALGFNAGLSPLIRPELAVVGGLTLLVVFFAPMSSWLLRVGFVVVAAVLPVGYQIFRMGYYGLLVPNTAIAKDASGSKWGQGWTYLTNLFGPYLLLVPMVAVMTAGFMLWRQQGLTESDTPKEGDANSAASRIGILRESLRSRRGVITLFVVGGLLESVYWIHQGGDFMHVRVLLVPLFLILLPLAVLPISITPLVESLRSASGIGRRLMAGGLGALWIVTVVWAAVIAQSPGMKNGTEIGRSGIVDERRYYIQNLGIAHPILARDYQDYPRMDSMVAAIKEYQKAGGVLISSGDYDTWFHVPQIPQTEPKRLTVYFLNLGMTSMNAPLSVRVIDQMGLAYPLASHTERLEDARIGHDKDLDNEWVVADSLGMPFHPELPMFLSQTWTLQAREALRCPETKELITSYTAPMSWAQFKANLRDARRLTSYRFDRIPYYELQRCHLPNPVPGTTSLRRPN